MAIKPIEILINAKDRATQVFASVRRSAEGFFGSVSDTGKASDGFNKLTQQLQVLRNVAATALGGSLIGSLARDTSAVADEYRNLQARIALVTGEGAALEAAFEGVKQVSLETNSELDATANLFTRILQAGKELGVSQEQALSLTRTINQAIQLSGASAAGSQAAIVQLVQGLQSGVLRGEEFNSVLEQSPRLAQALADGLGVTIGQLRALAKEGQLTSGTVISALQGQTAAVAAEFERLPPTIGRAVQNLSTNWTLYVGEVDKATGASEAVAAAINALGKNLQTIIDLLFDVGQAAAAFTALRLAQNFLAIGAAANTAAVGIGAAAAATRAAGVSAAATGATVAATGAAVAATAGRIATVLKTIRSFTLIGLLVNIKDIGVALGEGAARLAGYSDGVEELAEAQKREAIAARESTEMKQAMAQAMALAAEKARGLTPEARLLVTEFDKLRTSGKGASDALAELSKSANLQDTSGIQAFSIALRDLEVQGKASGDQIREAFANALKGEDLGVFEVNARAALSGARNEAELLSTVLDATLREAIRRSGADFDVISGGMGDAARSAINDTELIINNLDRLQQQGVNTADALTASIGRGIQTADSRAAIDALRQQIESVRRTLGNKVANTFLDQLNAKAKEVVGEIGGLSDALRRLGITSDADLKKAAQASRELFLQVVATGGSAREQGEAFRKMAADAIASGDDAALAFVRAQAAAQGFQLSTDSAGRTTVRAMKEAADATQGVGRAAEGAAGSYGNMAQSAADAAAAAGRLAEINQRFSRPGQSSTQQGNETRYDPGRNMYGRAGQKDQPVNGEGQTQAEFQREQRLAGQNAVDNTLIFALREKLNAGTLTPEDAQSLSNAIAALDQNEQVNRDLDRLNPAAFSLEGAADRNEWRNVRQQFAQALARLDGDRAFSPAGTARIGRTVNFNLQLNGSEYGPVDTSERGAENMERFLRDLERGKRSAA